MANPTVTKCLVGEARMNFARVFKPEAIDDQSEPKYSIVLTFPKTNKDLYKKIKAAIDECTEKAKNQYGGTLPTKYKIIEIQDGADWDEKFNLEDEWVLKASSSYKPEIVKKAKVMGKVQLVPITDEEEFYSGCYGYASVTFYAYDTKRSKGITCGLNSLLKSRDGEKLGAAPVSVEEDYAGVLDDVDEFENEDDNDVF